MPLCQLVPAIDISSSQKLEAVYLVSFDNSLKACGCIYTQKPTQNGLPISEQTIHL